MIRINSLKMPLSYTEESLRKACAERLRVQSESILKLEIIRRAVDARQHLHGEVYFVLTVDVDVHDEEKILEEFREDTAVAVAPLEKYNVPAFSKLKTSPVIVGCGPAGLFAAYTLALAGAAPILLERGADVETRKHDIEEFRSTGRLNPESNVQFGEGGAGTFSDGKLNTGTRDLRNRWVIKTFVECGAPSEILYQAKPHIGTDKLAPTIKNLREKIVALGGTVLFDARLTDFKTVNGQISEVSYEHCGATVTLATSQLILAVGHSARDIFALLEKKGIALAAKSFAVGLRIEHLQSMVDRCLYGRFAGHSALGAADYKAAVHLPNGRSVYTFCMCPGGEISAAASEIGGLVTNGMSYFARAGSNANSALLVGIDPSDFDGADSLAGVRLQQKIERAAFRAGGGDYTAPVDLVGDFLQGRVSQDFGEVKPTYKPGTKFVLPDEYLPKKVCESLRLGISTLAAQKNYQFFNAAEAVLTGPETRSSSPVRILRDEKCTSISVRGLYPCGEGAGYAGGIISAATDGIRCAEAVLDFA